MLRANRVHWPEQGLLAILLALCFSTSTASLAAPADIEAGIPLTEALTALQERGLAIVYSSALVTPELTVLKNPVGTSPREVLEEILSVHSLGIQEGPGQQLVVVRREPPGFGEIRGQVDTDGDPSLLAGAVVTLVEARQTTTVDDSGRFRFARVPVGAHTLTVESSLFLPARTAGVEVRSGKVSRVRFLLTPASVFLNQIVVTPSHFRILDEQPESRQFLTRDEVDRMPHAADDLYRAVKRLPGATGGDLTATFNVRGGVSDEVLVVLDGIELYEPFHLKDFQSVFSSVDAEAVGRVDFLTGAFPASYGDRMSGVMDIAIATPEQPRTTAIGIGTFNSRLLSEGTFHGGNGSWIISARGWYPGEVYEATRTTANEVLTDYYDVLAKVSHVVGERVTVSANLLAAYDDLGFRAVDAEEVEQVRASYSSYHLWLTLEHEWSEALFSRTIVSNGRIARERRGGVDDIEEGTLDITDDRTFTFTGLKQDWSWDIGNRHLLSWGFDVKEQRADYDYFSRSVVIDPEIIGDDGEPEVTELALDLTPEGTSYGVYLSDRFRLTESLVAELGVRWDRQSWIDDEQLSPRVNLRWAVSSGTTLRVAWGRFYQSQRLNELQVEDGVTELRPAQLAEHWLASIEQRLRPGMALRIEAYRKELSHLRPRYENLFNPIELFPEAQPDRVLVAATRGRAEGVELLLKQDGEAPISWWLSYATGRAEDSVNGTMVPRTWDQRHAASFGLNLKLPRQWNLNLAGTYHSGWPTTGATGEVTEWEDDEPVVELTYGPRNAERFPSFLRFDARVSRSFPLRGGELTLILEVLNLTNRQNVCCVEDFLWEVREDGSVEIIREESTWMPIVPSLAVRWEF